MFRHFYMGFCRKTYLRLCFAGVVMVLGDMEKVLFFFFPFSIIHFSVSSSVFVHDYRRALWSCLLTVGMPGTGWGKIWYLAWLYLFYDV